MNADTQGKPTPAPNPETQAFWDACSRGVLTVQQCDDCHHRQHYPRLLCTACGSQKLEQVAVSGTGRVISFTINRVPVSAAYADDVPYAVALVQLAEGPTMMGNLTDCDLAALHIGMQVEAHFEARGEILLPQFRPAARIQR